MKEFFRLVFCIPWARILLLFEAFGSVFQRQSSKRFRSDSSGGLDDGFLGWACALAAQKIVFRLFLVDSKGNVKEFFGSGFGRFRLVSRWCLGLFASKATACVLLFEAFGSGVPRPHFARPKRLFFVDSKGNVKEFFGSGFGRFRLVSRWCLGLFASKAIPLVFCCSRLSEAVFQGQISRGPKDCFFVDSKGNVKEFFGSGFGRFRLVSRWCLGLFASKATACVLLFEAFGSGVPRPHFARPKRLFFVDSKGNVKECFGSGFGRFRLVSRWCLGLFASKALRLPLVFCCSRLSEAAFQGQISRGPKDCFLWIPKITRKSFLDRVLGVFGSCPDGVWDFSHLRLPLVFCCSRLSEAVFQGQISRGPKHCFLWIRNVT